MITQSLRKQAIGDVEMLNSTSFSEEVNSLPQLDNAFDTKKKKYRVEKLVTQQNFRSKTN